MLTQAQIEDLIGYVCMSSRNRRLSYQQLAEGIKLSQSKLFIKANYENRIEPRCWEKGGSLGVA